MGETNFKSELGVDKAEFVNQLAALLSTNDTPIEIEKNGVELINIVSRIPWARGTQSSVYDLVIKPTEVKTKTSGNMPELMYALKVVRGVGSKVDADKKMMKELEILRATNDKALDSKVYSFSENRGVKLLPKCLSTHSEYFISNRFLLLEKIRGKSLMERVSELEGKVNLETDILPALDPVILLHDKLPLLYSYSNGQEKTWEQLVMKDIEILESWGNKPWNKWPAGVFEEIKEIDREIFKKIMDQKNITLIQKDGYPWHNFMNCLVDAGGVELGPRQLHLACLFGEKTVYQRLPENAFFKIGRSYIDKAFKAESDFYINLVQPNKLTRNAGISKLRAAYQEGSVSEVEKDNLAREFSDNMNILAATIGNGVLMKGMRQHGGGLGSRTLEKGYLTKETMEYASVIRKQLEDVAIHNPVIERKIHVIEKLELQGFNRVTSKV